MIPIIILLLLYIIIIINKYYFNKKARAGRGSYIGILGKCRSGLPGLSEY